jgi:hypothetical protein
VYLQWLIIAVKLSAKQTFCNHHLISLRITKLLLNTSCMFLQCPSLYIILEPQNRCCNCHSDLKNSCVCLLSLIGFGASSCVLNFVTSFVKTDQLILNMKWTRQHVLSVLAYACGCGCACELKELKGVKTAMLYEYKQVDAFRSLYIFGA